MSGIFGIVMGEGDCSETLLYGTDYHSHLGTAYGGMAVLGEEFFRQIHSISQSQFKSKFFDDARVMRGNKGIGAISDFDEQPIYLKSKFGPFCVVMNGFIDNAQELADELLTRGFSFSEVSHNKVNMTELVAKLITRGSDIPDGIEKALRVIKGSCSLLVLNNDGVYAARDRFGYSPLTIGKSDAGWAITTETAAFPNTGFEPIKHLEPGEIVLVTEKGLAQKRKGSGCPRQICLFLWIYTGFPASTYEGINVEVVRERCGRALARHDKGLKADLVTGVPDSGVAHAIGYAMESGVPLRRSLVKYTPGYGRSYVPPSQKTRDLVARMKLIAIKEITKGKKVVICEDSIVRGTQLKNFTINKLWDGGAVEVHVRPACPPLMFPCRFNLSTRSIHELAARKAIHSIEGKEIEDVSEYIDPASTKYRKMVEWIARDLEVTSLKFQTLGDMIKAIGLPEEKLCTYCWTGKSPDEPAKKKAKARRA